MLDYAPARLTRGVLEIGAGTGKATIPVARRGLDLTAVEPAAAMAQILRSRAEGAGVGDRARVRVATFEDHSGRVTEIGYGTVPAAWLGFTIRAPRARPVAV